MTTTMEACEVGIKAMVSRRFPIFLALAFDTEAAHELIFDEVERLLVPFEHELVDFVP